MKLIAFFLILKLSNCLSETVIKSRELDFGEFQPWDVCRTGTYSNGFARKADRRADDFFNDVKGLTGILLLCKGDGGVESNQIFSDYNDDGTWFADKNCTEGHYLNGFRLKVEEYRGWFVDDRGATDLEMSCTSGQTLSSTWNESGDWDDWKMCPKGQRICGISTKIERDHWYNTDTMGLVAVKMSCCPQPIQISSSDVIVPYKQDETTIEGELFHEVELEKEQNINAATENETNETANTIENNLNKLTENVDVAILTEKINTTTTELPLEILQKNVSTLEHDTEINAIRNDTILVETDSVAVAENVTAVPKTVNVTTTKPPSEVFDDTFIPNVYDDLNGTYDLGDSEDVLIDVVEFVDVAPVDASFDYAYVALYGLLAIVCIICAITLFVVLLKKRSKKVELA